MVACRFQVLDFFNVGALFDGLAVACEMGRGHRLDYSSAAGQSLEGGAWSAHTHLALPVVGYKELELFRNGCFLRSA